MVKPDKISLETMKRMDEKLAVSRKSECAGCISQEKHPIECPWCGNPSNIEDLPIDYARQPNGMRDAEGTQWQCPHCEMVVHPYD